MCGIFGCVGELSAKGAWECIKAISHRGPDAQQVHALEGSVLAHTRLSIQDTSSASNQPMSDEHGRFWIVYNGEVYNYIELRADLQKRGYHFKTDGDTEVILYAYIEWGESFQYKCNGMWAAAIWDDWEKSLFLSRDRFGIKPLYYYRQDGAFYFASEMKAFFPVMKQKNINYNIFEQKDYFCYEATEDCSILGIKKIKAGYYAVYKNNVLTITKWWDTLDHLIETPRSYNRQVECLADLFLDACKIRMRSDVPIGTALSGGVDSSAVAGAMKKIAVGNDQYVNKDWQHTFVASMPNTTIDETIYAENASRYIGVDVKKVMVSGKVAPDELLYYMYLCEEPYITSPIPFMQTYHTIADSGIKVTVDGHGADELFGGYSFDLYYAGKELRNNPRKLKKILDLYNEAVLPEDKISYEQMLNQIDHLGNKRNRDKRWRKDDALNRCLYQETHERVLPTLFRCYDRYSMGNGMEIRMPFMDYRIVCFAFSIPWSSKVRNGYTKSIVRDMASMFMDKEVIYRKLKIGFNSPMTEWFYGDLKEFLLDTVHSKDFYECNLINPLEVSVLVDNFYAEDHQKRSAGETLWTALVPYFWKKAVIDASWGERCSV